MSFVHLHTHSHYSLLDGLAKIDDLVSKAKECGMPALALTDHGVMYGAVEFYQKATKAGIKPIIGVEAYVARNGRHQKRARVDEKPYHLVLLAKNETGYKNLVRLTTLAHMEGFYYKPRIDWELLEQHSEGVIALSACIAGEIAQDILNRPAETEKAVEKCLEVFGRENFFLEVQHHPSIPEQAKVNEGIFSLAGKYGISAVATNDIHYLNSEDDEAHDILICLQTKKKLSDENRMSMTGDDFSFLTAEKMGENFKDHPEVIANTLKVAEMCNFEMSLGKDLLPHYELPEGETAESLVAKMCRKGMEKRYAEELKDPERKKELEDRLEYELSVIEKTGFASYFLIVQDFINWAKDTGIVVGPGRGSAAGSIVAYVLNITDIEPLKYGLLFERFLNPDRISMPDIDTDFADTRRDEVIRYVEDKYGKDHVCQIITFGTMAARAAVRDVGRVLDLPYAYCDKVAKLIPMGCKIKEALEGDELAQIYKADADGKKLLDMAQKLEGVCRHSSTHACAVIISKDPLIELIPSQYSSTSDQNVVSQYEGNSSEAIGLLKMDFLGLKNLTLIDNALRIIEAVRGVKIDMDRVPLDDDKTFRLLQKGETTGVFQLESSGMKRYLKQLKPTVFEDIIAMCALYRPGPLSAGFVDMFVRRKNGLEAITYDHPDVEPILKATYGVTVYQEQVMQISRKLAGFTGGQADTLRKAIGKKKADLLAKMEKEFVEGCVKCGAGAKIADKIWNDWQGFAQYAFNKSHSACYAMIAYRTAYLKANYPVEFMTALLAADQGDLDRVAIEAEECRDMGIEVLPPSINESFGSFTVVKADSKDPKESNRRDRIRFGLLTVKNVGENIVKAIIEERKENGVYQSLEDFLRRVDCKDLNKKSLESLSKAGAMEEFGERNLLLANMDKMLGFIKSIQKEKGNGQTSLFSSLSEGQQKKPGSYAFRLDPADPASQQQNLAWEKEYLGLYVSDHPFREYAPYLKGKAVPCRRMKEYLLHESVKMAGIITASKKIMTRSNKPMLFVKMEDTSGNVEVLVFPKTLEADAGIWEEGKTLLVTGRLSDKDGEIKLLAQEAKELDLETIRKNNPGIRLDMVRDAGSISYGAVAGRGIYIFIKQENLGPAFERLKNILSRYSGNDKVYLKLIGDNSRKTIATNFFMDYDEDIAREIESVLGEGAIKVVRNRE